MEDVKEALSRVGEKAVLKVTLKNENIFFAVCQKVFEDKIMVSLVTDALQEIAISDIDEIQVFSSAEIIKIFSNLIEKRQNLLQSMDELNHEIKNFAKELL